MELSQELNGRPSAGTFLLRMFALACVAVWFQVVSLSFVAMNILQSYCAFIALFFFSPARQQEQPVDQNGWLQHHRKKSPGSLSSRVQDRFHSGINNNYA